MVNLRYQLTNTTTKLVSMISCSIDSRWTYYYCNLPMQKDTETRNCQCLLQPSTSHSLHHRHLSRKHHTRRRHLLGHLEAYLGPSWEVPMKFPGQHWDFTGLHHLKILQQQQHWYLTYHIYIHILSTCGSNGYDPSPGS